MTFIYIYIQILILQFKTLYLFVSGYIIVSWSCVWGTLLCLGPVSFQTFFTFFKAF